MSGDSPFFILLFPPPRGCEIRDTRCMGTNTQRAGLHATTLTLTSAESTRTHRGQTKTSRDTKTLRRRGFNSYHTYIPLSSTLKQRLIRKHNIFVLVINKQSFYQQGCNVLRDRPSALTTIPDVSHFDGKTKIIRSISAA